MKLLEATTRSSPSWGIAIDIKCAKDITLYVLRCILQLLHHTTHFRVDAFYYIHEGQCYRLHAQQNLSRTRLEAYAVPTLISIVLPRAGRCHHSSFSRKGGYASKEQSAMFFRKSSND